jgi:hypothetical protein
MDGSEKEGGDEPQSQSEVKGSNPKGKSCKGYLYYHSALKSKARNPRCIGISRTLQQGHRFPILAFLFLCSNLNLISLWNWLRFHNYSSIVFFYYTLYLNCYNQSNKAHFHNLIIGSQ